MSRKANGEGTITKLPSGKYRYRVVVTIDGIEQRKSFTGTSPTAAKKAYRDWLASDHKVAIEKVVTVKQWAEHWLEVYKKPNVSWKVHNDYKLYVEKHINIQIGGLKLRDVRPAHIAKLYAEAKNRTGKPLKRTSIEKIKIALNGIFETAIDNSFCARNPAKKVPLPEPEPQKVNVFTQQQMKQIVDYLSIHENGPYIALLLYTGLRIGELLALMWSDIDTENKLIAVRRSLTRTEDGEVIGATTKTKRERTIPYDDVLGKYIGMIPKQGIYVICRTNGSFCTHSAFDTIYYKFFSDLNETLEEDDKIPRMTPHKCRHTFATYMLRSGVNIRVVQALLGHSTIKTTEIYTEVDVDDLKGNISKLKFQ